MKQFSLLVLALLTLNTFANDKECRQILSNNGYDDSTHYVIDSDEVEPKDFGRDYLAESIYFIRHLIEREGCNKHAINFGRGSRGRSSSRCKNIVDDMPNSLSCYVETNLGYFFVTRDFLTKVHVIFNRWD